MTQDEEMNKILKSAQAAYPYFEYLLEDYDERFLSTVPLSVGDYVTLNINEEEKIEKKRIKEIHHRVTFYTADKRILMAGITLEED